MWVPVLVVALALGFAALWFVVTRGGELSVVLPGRAAALLTAVESKAALPVLKAEPVDRSGPDGPMPEIAGRQLVIDADAAAITARFRQACRTLGLAPADAQRLAIEPQVLCDGGKDHNGESVHLSLKCSGTCTAYLQIQVLGS